MHWTIYFIVSYGDPLCFVIRPVTGLVHSGEADILIEFLSISEAHFRENCQPLEYNLAGVSAQLENYEKGDKKTIAVDKLFSASETPSKRDLNRIRLDRKRFFQQIREATQHLQESVLMTLNRLMPDIEQYRTEAEGFWEKFGRPIDSDGFDRHALSFEVGRKGR